MLEGINEAFPVSCWEEPEAARQRRDKRVEELQTQGFSCHSQTLYTVDGRSVFVVMAHPPKIDLPKPIKTGATQDSKQIPIPRPRRRVVAFERR